MNFIDPVADLSDPVVAQGAVAEGQGAPALAPESWFDIGGVPLDKLVLRAQQTPFFAYDRRALDSRIAQLRAALPEEVDLFYSMKANPFDPLVHHLAARVDGFDVSSGAELAQALNAGVAAEDIAFAGPGKNDRELTLAVATGAILSVESAGELGRIERIAGELGIAPRLILRVNPELDLKGVGMRMGGEPRQFGVDMEFCLDLVRRLMATHGDNFLGYHVFWGSQCLKADMIIAAQAGTIDALVALSDQAGFVPRLINLGGGFGIAYSDGSPPLDLTAVGTALAPRLAALRQRFGSVRVVIELGRYLVGEAGYYVCRVLDRKMSRGEIFLVTDGGMHHHLAASGNLGQILRRNYPMLVGNRADAPPFEKAHVAGCLCTPIDMLGHNVALPQTEAGDLIVIRQSGAYGPSSSPSGFLSHPAATELLV
ncbi:pyridoxal-dependent decarboxylase, exosortase A system-associated [Sphingobium sufflavum]|uniref:pyridoxal-dependent decarboxylase, exosortase A system-associated n=1 Tax=Sphingobium sufflavum TaxID=1129547 RepID=UPI001F3B26F0|nr:pyridoxal-dependent decarboxylase, exosortase A system-associated [Sphingobium sufflavum]MCE7797232.1 pyridoxal-dependent decarboxylase, exosortase A system-associated [Sphingobium sufflavum]